MRRRDGAGRLHYGCASERFEHLPRVTRRHGGAPAPGYASRNVTQWSSGTSPAAQKPAGRARSHAGSPTPRSSMSISTQGSEAGRRPSWPRCQSPCTSVAGRSGEPARHTSGAARRPPAGRWRRRWIAACAAAAAATRVVTAWSSIRRADVPAVDPPRPTARIQVAAQQFPLWASGSAIVCRPAPASDPVVSAENPTPPRCGAGSPTHWGRCPAGAACKPRRRRRRFLHRTGYAALDRISAWAAAGALSRQCGSRR